MRGPNDPTGSAGRPIGGFLGRPGTTKAPKNRRRDTARSDAEAIAGAGALTTGALAGAAALGAGQAAEIAATRALLEAAGLPPGTAQAQAVAAYKASQETLFAALDEALSGADIPMDRPIKLSMDRAVLRPVRSAGGPLCRSPLSVPPGTPQGALLARLFEPECGLREAVVRTALLRLVLESMGPAALAAALGPSLAAGLPAGLMAGPAPAGGPAAQAAFAAMLGRGGVVSGVGGPLTVTVQQGSVTAVTPT